MTAARLLYLLALTIFLLGAALLTLIDPVLTALLAAMWLVGEAVFATLAARRRLDRVKREFRSKTEPRGRDVG